MSAVSFAVSEKLSSSTATALSTGRRLTLVSLLLFGAAGVASADQFGVELLATSVASVSTGPEAPIDEIVVIGNRDKPDSLRPGPVIEDPLLEDILEDFEMRHELEKEAETRLQLLEAESEPFAIRVGYDAYAATREALEQQHRELPLDLVRPATVISIDF